MVRMTAEEFKRLTGLEPRKNQAETAASIIEAIQNGERLIVLEAPPGTGKSVIAYAVAASIKGLSVISTFTLQLQHQYKSLTRWPYLMGRRNYICPITRSTAESAPCIQGATCTVDCVLRRHRERVRWRRAILNHALLFTLIRFRDPIANRRLIILDECQRLPDAFASIFSMQPEEAAEAAEIMERHRIRSRASLLRSGLTGREYELVSRYLAASDIAREYPNFYSSLQLTDPSIVFHVLPKGAFVLLLSATIPPFMRHAGVHLSMESPIPGSNRPLIWAPAGAMNRINFPTFVPQIVHLARLLVRQGPGIIHAHNLEAAQIIFRQLRLAGVRAYLAAGNERTRVIRSFLRDIGASALVGPGLSEGIDARNICWQIIPKVLWPDISEPSPTALPPEHEAAVRVAQAYGRAPRDPRQTCRTFVLDEHFGRITNLLPEYVRSAIVRADLNTIMQALKEE